MPFSLLGSLDDPKFSLGGVPQFIRGTNSQPQPQESQQQQPSQQPSLQDLFKFFH